MQLIPLPKPRNPPGYPVLHSILFLFSKSHMGDQNAPSDAITCLNIYTSFSPSTIDSKPRPHLTHLEPFQTIFLLFELSVIPALHLRAEATVTGVVTPVETATAAGPPFAVNVNAKDSTPV